MHAIARALEIEQSTVASHWKRICRKLAMNRSQIREWVRKRLNTLAKHSAGDQ
jgi:DNA-binding NarL/FixJ family response regulator